jgi:hypothetical protein
MTTHSGCNGSERRSLWSGARWIALLGTTTATVLLGASVALAADGVRGGLMYDKWWDVTAQRSRRAITPSIPPT